MAPAQPAAAYKTPEWPVPSTLDDNDTISLRGQQEKILMAAAQTAEVAEAAERKGPWTKEEDAQLVWYVRLFGERRWDHLAKVSGLNRSGKSCRLRWVNYLHPGLKHGRLNPQEELLVLQLHAKWGNRWSRIAACLPGRTDNEIKNYWRTHMRKEAQERKSLTMNSSSLSWMSTSSSASSWFHGSSASGNGETSKHGHETESAAEEAYSMDEIWAELDAAESVSDEFKNDCTGERFPWKQKDDEELIHHDY